MKNQKGYVLITTGLSLLFLLSTFALVADLGHIFVTKSELQNTADAASLAAVVDIPQGETVARQKALVFGESHWVAGSQILIADPDIRFGNYDFQTSQTDWGAQPFNAVEVKAKRVTDSPSGPLPLFFAQLFGKDFSNVEASARAVLDRHVVGVKGKNRLIPYSVIDFVVDEDFDGNFDLGKIINIHPRNDAPGNFGFLDLDGGSNDIPELRLYIEEGYDKDFTIPVGGSVPVLGSPGINGVSVLASFNNILNEVVFLPVHDHVEFEGDQGTFNVIAILAVRIKEVKLNGAITQRYIKTEIISFASSVLVTNPDAPENNSVAKPRLVA
ncbi:MAG: Tad domain-containing protein [Candidatus Omnitrophica bacterium]|nr:Tad domain-containing protein [Candidatus Omnitrophota bacterium]